jgi:hypothetical protein
MRLLMESYDVADGRVHYADPTVDSNYLQDVVEIVDYIGTKPDTYVLVSLWIDPSFNDLGWPTSDTIEVWEVVAEALVGRPHVLFGLVNEPAENFEGAQDAQVWEAMNDTVAAIRAVEAAAGSDQHIIAVQGTRAWGRHLGYYVENPITAGGGTNIAYEHHSYLPPEEFDEYWAVADETLPVIIGELGPFDNPEVSVSDTNEAIDLAESLDTPWLAWTFHMRCDPSMLVDNSDNSGDSGCGGGMDLEPTDWGTNIRNRLSEPWGQ